ncbi:nostrin-like isoform X2 [Ptychodera flava]
MKQGFDFCKEMASIFNDRAELESAYGKGLLKLSQRTSKQTNYCLGSLCTALKAVASNFESEAQVHSTLGQTMKDELYKQVKAFTEEQNKSKKDVEHSVEKTSKMLQEKRQDFAKVKKTTFSRVKESELLFDQIEKQQSGGNKKSKVISDKELAKLQSKQKKVEDSAMKSDQEYMEVTKQVERARHDFERSMGRYAVQMQALEEQRLQNLQEILNKYHSHLSRIGPKLVESCTDLFSAVSRMDTDSDIKVITAEKGTGATVSGQLLYECYEEDLNNSMKPERRQSSIQTKIHHFGLEIEKERKQKEGVQHLTGVYTENPAFTSNAGMDDAVLQIQHADAMINTLMASQYKLQCALALMDRKAKPEHRLSSYITSSKDKSGLQQSMLNLPVVGGLGGRKTDVEGAAAMTRTPAEGAQSHNFAQRLDEFNDTVPEVVCRCRALYDFIPSQKDELMLSAGDVISVHEKQGDGWWLGELKGNVGLFPESYVEEI